MPNSDHFRPPAFVAPVRGRSIAIVLGAAVLSIGASAALLLIDGPRVSTASKATATVAQAQREPAQAASTDSVRPPQCKERPLQQTWPNRPGDCVTRAELRANSMRQIDPDVIPPAAPAGAEAPKQVASVPAAAETLKQVASVSAAVAASAEPKRTRGVASPAIPVPRPAPRPKTTGVAAGAEEAIAPAERERLAAASSTNGKHQDGAIPHDISENRSKRADTSIKHRRPRGPLKLISMLFSSKRR